MAADGGGRTARRGLAHGGLRLTLADDGVGAAAARRNGLPARLTARAGIGLHIVVSVGLPDSRTRPRRGGLPGGGAAVGRERLLDAALLYRQRGQLKGQDIPNIKVQDRGADRVVGPLVQKAENQLCDQPSNRAGENTDDRGKEHVGGIVRHQVVAGDAHDQDDDHRGHHPLFAAHEADGRHACGAGRHMAGGEGKAVLRRRAEEGPPVVILGHGLKGPDTRHVILENNVGDQRAAADGAEDAHTQIPPVGAEHEDQRQQEEDDALLAQEGDQPHQRRQNHAKLRGDGVQDRQKEMIVAGKKRVQPDCRSGRVHNSPSFRNCFVTNIHDTVTNCKIFSWRVANSFCPWYHGDRKTRCPFCAQRHKMRLMHSPPRLRRYKTLSQCFMGD